MNLPKDFILILSGVSCVGKTTTAYNLLKHFPEFRRVSELDIIKTTIRTTIKDIELICPSDKDKIYDTYQDVFSSMSEADTVTYKKQAKLLTKYVKEIVKRQQTRKIPTIIEGIGIVPSVYFNHNRPIDGFEKNILFINLYVSDLAEHIKRRLERCQEREYTKDIDTIKEKIYRMRSKNKLLHEETLKLQEKTNNVFSLDIAYLNKDDTIYSIKEIIKTYIQTI